MDTSRRTIRVVRRQDADQANDYAGTTPAERLGMMWPLALDAWAFLGEPVHEPRLPRHVARVLRGGR